MRRNDLINVGIVGCGGIAFYKHLPGLAKSGLACIIACTDINYHAAVKAKNEYGISETKVYKNYMELINDDKVDVVHVCSANNSHAEISIAALNAGKHVLCEKPMALTTDDARAMISASVINKRKLSISYQNRFRNDVTYLKSLCESGYFGEIYYLKAHAIRRRGIPTWGVYKDSSVQGGGCMIDIGSHALDLALWLADNYQPKSVLCQTYCKIANKPGFSNRWGQWEHKNFSMEDLAVGLITMKDGTSIYLESSWALNCLQQGEAMVTLCGTNAGADMWNGLRLNGELNGKLYENFLEMDYENKGQNPGYAEMQNWMDCIIEDKDPVVKAEQALIVTQIMEALYRSARILQPVEIKI